MAAARARSCARADNARRSSARSRSARRSRSPTRSLPTQATVATSARKATPTKLPTRMAGPPRNSARIQDATSRAATTAAAHHGSVTAPVTGSKPGSEKPSNFMKFTKFMPPSPRPRIPRSMAQRVRGDHPEREGCHSAADAHDAGPRRALRLPRRHSMAGPSSPAPASGGPVDPALIEDLVAASRILAAEGVLDGYGHVSMRHPGHAERYLMSRSLAPALVTADDIMELDLESNPVDARGRTMFRERFIHGMIFNARPDVMAVVHSHSPAVIPFGITQVPMQPTFHMAAFLYRQPPVFEIRDVAGWTNMLITSNQLGAALADTLGDNPVALMRGHGNVVVGPSLPI